MKDLVESIKFGKLIGGIDTSAKDKQKPPSTKYWNDTTIGEKYKRLEDNIAHLKGVPRMSTKAIGLVINGLVDQMDRKHAYVNVGVWHGYSLLAGIAGNAEKICVGIDNFSQFGGPRKDFMKRFNKLKTDKHHFFDCDYRKFFEDKCEWTIGVYFYDGNHKRENQFQGLLKAEPFFSENCYIIIDDANSKKVQDGTKDFLDASKNRYETIFDIRTRGNSYASFWNGLMLLKRI